MSNLKTSDKRPFELLFGMQSGYVMDFTNNSFAEFFSEHGIDIYSDKYAFIGDSKAKRLRAFWQVEPNELVADILSALVEYSRLVPLFQKGNDPKLIDSCEIVIQKLHNRKSLYPSLESVKEMAVVFDAEYLSKQIRRMEQSIESDPTLAIGTAKELVETCCRTILNGRGKPVQGTPDVPAIIKATLKELRLVPDEIPEHTRGADVIRRLTSNLASVLQGLVELRNLYGTGHGKEGTTQTLMPIHAKLAVGAAATLATFLFETYKTGK